METVWGCTPVTPVFCRHELESSCKVAGQLEPHIKLSHPSFTHPPKKIKKKEVKS